LKFTPLEQQLGIQPYLVGLNEAEINAEDSEIVIPPDANPIQSTNANLTFQNASEMEEMTTTMMAPISNATANVNQEVNTEDPEITMVDISTDDQTLQDDVHDNPPNSNLNANSITQVETAKPNPALTPNERSTPKPPQEASESSNIQGSRNENWMDLAFGFFALLTDSVVAYPFRTFRWRLQVIPAKFPEKSMITFFRNNLLKRGLSGLWQGFWIRNFSETLCLYFTRRMIRIFPPPIEKNIPYHLHSVCINGLCFLGAFPFYRTSFLLALQCNYAPTQVRFKGVIDCLIDFGSFFNTIPNLEISNNRLPFYVIAPPTICHHLIRNIVFSFVINGFAKLHRGKKKRKHPTTLDELFPKFLTSATAMMITRVLLFPLEKISNQLIVQGTGVMEPAAETFYRGFWDCATNIFKEGGIIGLYYGAQFLAYQLGMSMLILQSLKSLQRFIKSGIESSQ